MGKDISRHVGNRDEMEALGLELAAPLRGNAACVTLSGDLGAGKTTLVRAILRGLGHSGVVRSPTYTLMEEYPLQPLVLHLDLYRLADPEELDYLGLRDALAEGPLIFVEWPERGEGALPEVDIAIQIDYQGSGRVVTLLPVSETGRGLLGGFADGGVNA